MTQFDIRDYVTVAAVCLVLVWDFWLARKGEGGTLSYRWATWSKQWPIIPLLAGILLGHLFFPNRAYCPCTAAVCSAVASPCPPTVQEGPNQVPSRP